MKLEEPEVTDLQTLAGDAVRLLRTLVADECRSTNEAMKVLEARCLAAEERLQIAEDRSADWEEQRQRLARVEAVVRDILESGELLGPTTVWRRLRTLFVQAGGATNGSGK